MTSTHRDIDMETAQIMSRTIADMFGRPMIAVIERDGQWIIYQHGEQSVMPSTSYPTKRAAAARILQLLGVGPVGPQMFPEEVEIGSIQSAPSPSGRDDG